MQFLKKWTKKETPVEHFFALNISEETAQAAVWRVTDGQTTVVSLGKPVSWDGKDKDGLLAAADKTLSQAAENLKPEPNGVIFGLPESWTENNLINQEKKPYLKFLCDQLGLKPLGFVVSGAAVMAYLKAEEGTPVSAILVQLSSGEINLMLVKMGKVIGSQLVGRSGDLGADTEEALSRFDREEALPARIILYNGGGDFEEDKQQLLSYDWEDKLPFIHFPKVESLSADTVVRAVALGGGSELAGTLGIEVKPPETAAPSAADLGFKANEDVVKAEPTPEPPSEPPAKQPELKPGPKRLWFRRPKIDFRRLLSLFPRRRWLTIAAAGLAILTGLLLALYWYLPRATVAIYLEPQLIDEDLELELDLSGGGSDQVLAASEVEKTVSGSRSIPVTGTATVGDPAAGGVTLYNKTASVKTFAAGTALVGPDNLVFTLDEETTVASRSAEEDSEGVITITPGKAEGQITAAGIGPEGNLSADTRLSFKQYSEDDYYAKTSGLSGGSAREVKAVGESDRQELAEVLTAALAEQARTEITGSLSADQRFVVLAEEPELTEAEFSHEDGDEADELSLAGELTYNGAVYRQPDLIRLLTEAIKTKVPENYSVSGFSESDIRLIDGGRELSVVFQANLLPRVDLAELAAKLRGRYPETVEKYLVTLPRFVSADIKITPPLPKVLKTLPRLTKNISVEIKPAQ